MNNIYHLSKKEFLEFLRSSKFIWIPIVFIILGIIQPVTLYYMDDILKATNSMPKGMNFAMPTPTNVEAMGSVLSQFSTIGTLVIIGTTMPSIVEEYNKGQVALLFVRPVTNIHYVVSKSFSYSLLFILSFFLSIFVSSYYISILYKPISVSILLQSTGAIALWILFVVSITLLFSSILKSSSATFGVTTLFCAALALVQSLIPNVMSISPTNLFTVANNILLGVKDSDLPLTICTSILYIILLNLITIFSVKKKIIHS